MVEIKLDPLAKPFDPEVFIAYLQRRPETFADYLSLEGNGLVALVFEEQES